MDAPFTARDYFFAFTIGLGALSFGAVVLGRMMWQGQRRVRRVREAFLEGLKEAGRRVKIITVDFRAEGICPLCRHSFSFAPTLTCPACRTPSHEDCWRWNNGCAVYACVRRRPPGGR